MAKLLAVASLISAVEPTSLVLVPMLVFTGKVTAGISALATVGSVAASRANTRAEQKKYAEGVLGDIKEIIEKDNLDQNAVHSALTILSNSRFTDDAKKQIAQEILKIYNAQLEQEKLERRNADIEKWNAQLNDYQNQHKYTEAIALVNKVDIDESQKKSVLNSLESMKVHYENTQNFESVINKANDALKKNNVSEALRICRNASLPQEWKDILSNQIHALST